jgi:predicted nucleic acid-binding Zn ribbon protein
MNDVSHAHAPAAHAPDGRTDSTSASSLTTPVALRDQRACLVCRRSLEGRRPETLTCSSRCRSVLSRLKRRDDLVARVRRAETALTEAADALGSLRELAGLDATLELGALLKRSAR